MMKNVRILVAAAACVLLGMPLLAEEPVPVIQGMGAEAGPSGPVLRVRATGELETVHYSPQPGVWVVELPEASWDPGSGLIVEPDIGIERAELNHVDEFGKRVSRLTVWLNEPAQLTMGRFAGGLELNFTSFGGRDSEWSTAVTREDVAVTSKSHFEEPEPATPTSLAGAPSLLDVVPTRAGGGVVVELKSDRPISVQAFTLPERCWDSGLVEELAERDGIIIAGGQDSYKGRIVRTGFPGLYGNEALVRYVSGMATALDNRGCVIDADAVEKAIGVLSDHGEIF